MSKFMGFKKLSHLLFFLFMSLFFVLPFLSLVLWSFTKLWPWPHLLPDNFSLDSWTYLFSQSGRAVEGLYNSLIVAFITWVGNILLGIPAARVLSQKKFIGKGFVFITLLAPLFIPLTVSIMGLHQIAVQFDFINNWIRVGISHILITLPYFIVTIWYQYGLIGSNLQEAARSLGAKEWKVFLWIELPLLFPSILLSSSLVIIISFSQYLPTWIMSGGTLLTLPIIIFPYASSGNTSIVSAYSIWLFIPIVLFVATYFIGIQLNKKKMWR